ncbi:MAG: bifunctional pyr operon transcriptional regulator/uracil phosphoribosyltransferase PyrR [Cytophagales bacterium]
MSKRLIFDSEHLQIVIERLCRQLIENYDNFEDTVIMGIQPRGVYLASRIKNKLEEILETKIQFGKLDISFYRDDYKRREISEIFEMDVPFVIENKNVILVDDVLFTGRTIRASLDAMVDFGRARKVELLVLVDRKLTRELPVYAQYVGKKVNTILTERIVVELKEQGHAQDGVWIVDKKVDI